MIESKFAISCGIMYIVSYLVGLRRMVTLIALNSIERHYSGLSIQRRKTQQVLFTGPGKVVLRTAEGDAMFSMAKIQKDDRWPTRHQLYSVPQ